MQVGGGAGYEEVYCAGDATATTAANLVSALAAASSGEVIYVANDINLTGTYPIAVPSGVILAGNRGYPTGSGGYSRGPRLYTTDRSQHLYGQFTLGNASVFTGLRLEGPDCMFNSPLPSGATRYYGRGISSDGINAEITNCEIYGWTHAGIYCDVLGRIIVEYCHIHNNLMDGLGYGVVLVAGDVQADISYCLFESNRHDVTASGGGTNYYKVHNNYFKGGGIPAAYSHERVNFHETGGVSGSYLIEDNVFDCPDLYGISIEGTPDVASQILTNYFIHSEQCIVLAGTGTTCTGNTFGPDITVQYVLGDSNTIDGVLKAAGTYP